jgi:dTDP-4-amino-4,6-dideoxygalactose transaminase
MMDRFQRFEQYLYTISEAPHEKIGPHAFPIVVKENVPFSRNQLVDFMEKGGIDTRSLFLSMPTQCPGFGFLNYQMGDFPNAEYIGENGLHIGVHQDIGEEEIEYVMNTIAEFLEKHS